MKTNIQVTIILIDDPLNRDQSVGSNLFNLLFQKMQHQIKGFVLWFERREKILNEIQNNNYRDDDEHFVPKSFSDWIEKEEYLKREMGFLPIEFSLNRECLIAYALVCNLFTLPEQMFSNVERVEWNDDEWEHEELKRNEGLILSSLFLDQNDSGLFECLPDELRHSREFLKKSLDMCGTFIRNVDGRYLEDREIVWRAVKNSPVSLLDTIPERYSDDEEIVLTSCSFCPADAELMSNRLSGDRSFILKLLEKVPQTFKWAHTELLQDLNFVMECLEIGGTQLFEQIPTQILEPIVKDINVLKSVSSKSFVLAYFSRALEMFYPPEIVSSIKSELSNDREFAYECTRNEPTAAYFFSGNFRMEKEFIKLSKSLNIKDKSGLDSHFFKEMYRLDIQNFHYMPHEYKMNKGFVLELMEINGLGLEFLTTQLRTDLDVVCRAIQQNGSSIYVALSKERRNRKLQEMASESNGYFEYNNAEETTFRKHLRLRLDKAYFGFDIPERFCTSNKAKFLIGKTMDW